MAVIGGGGVNDIYTDSTATIGVASVVAGESLKLDSNSTLLPIEAITLNEVERAAGDIGDATWANTPWYQYGNPVLPDGRSLYGLLTASGNAKFVILSTDGQTQQGTNYIQLTQGNTSGYARFIFWQIGEVDDYYLAGIAYITYHSNTYFYQLVHTLKISKVGDTISSSAMPTASYTNYYVNGSYVADRFQNKDDVNNWHTCRDNTVSLFAASKNSLTSYLFTAQTIGSTGSFSGTVGTVTLENTTYNHATDIVKIDDANGIFLVLHQTGSTEKTLTKVVVSSSAAITTSTVATIDNSYSGLHSNINRSLVTMVGSGTGSTNLCFFDNYSSTQLSVHPCTYNSSNDALTWGTYALLDTPTSGGVRYTWYGSSTQRRIDRHTWTYSPAYHKVYFGQMTYGEGLVLDIENSTLKVANISNKLSSTASIYTNLVASKSGTELIQLTDTSGIKFLSRVLAYGVDTGMLVTSNAAAIALEAGVSGETIDISLLNGITSESSDLPATYYLKKNDLFFPYTVYVGGVLASAALDSVIKSIQRGKATVTSNTSATITIEEVNLSKTFFVFGGSTNYNNSAGYALYMDDVTTTSFKLKSTGYSGNGFGSWEVIEYV